MAKAGKQAQTFKTRKFSAAKAYLLKTSLPIGIFYVLYLYIDWQFTGDLHSLVFPLAGAIFLAGWANYEVVRLSRHIKIEDVTPIAKAKEALEADRHAPKHVPDKMPEGATAKDRLFYEQFAPLADLLNKWHKHTAWSFENTGELRAAGFVSERERRIRVYYNEWATGLLTIKQFDYGNLDLDDRHSPPFEATLWIANARTFEPHGIFNLVVSVSNVIELSLSEADNVGVRDKATAFINRTMIGTMWLIGEEAPGNPEFEVTFGGKAEWYLSMELWKRSK